MPAYLDTVNNISTLNTAAGLLAQNPDLKKLKQKEKTGKAQKFKTLLKKQLFERTEEKEEIYNLRLEGLSKEEIIVKLQDSVYSAGDALADKVSPENIIFYKQAVKNFMQFILANTYDVENIVTGGVNPLKKKAWIIVKIIDEKLDKLTKELIFNQLKKIDILKRLDEIKGLLVDLTG